MSRSGIFFSGIAVSAFAIRLRHSPSPFAFAIRLRQLANGGALPLGSSAFQIKFDILSRNIFEQELSNLKRPFSVSPLWRNNKDF